MITTPMRRSLICRIFQTHRSALRVPVFAAVLVVVAAGSAGCRRATPAPAPAADATPPPPPPPAPAPTITLTATPGTIDAGGMVTLEWQSRNAATVQIEPGIGSVAATGMRSISPTSSVTYTATATGPGGTATATTRVTVNAPRPATPPPAPTTPSPTIDELFRANVQTVYFDFDKADIRPDQVARLQASARFLRENQGIQFTISGHADERGSQEYNIGLGDRRANAVRQFLVGQGVAASRMNTASFGEDRPVCTQSNEGCWSRNRRAEFARR